MDTTFSTQYLAQIQEIAARIDPKSVEKMVVDLSILRKRGGRLFCLGSGGGAGHSSHAACDFRKLCGIETYCPTDNASELTARINDHGWENSLVGCLQASRLTSDDGIFIFSVGGGDSERRISENLVEAVRYAKKIGASVYGIVGRDGGFTARNANACIVIPTIDANLVTPHTESFQAVAWHLLVSHPDLQLTPAKWESGK